MKYTAKNFSQLLGIIGFSDKLFANHFTLYEGYVNNINKLEEIILALEKEEKFTVPEYAELNRRFGWEWNGMRLHEYYFENMTKNENKLEENSELFGRINKEWGNFSNFEKDFKSMGAMRGIGWIVLYYDKIGERIFNVWVNEHDSGHLSGAVPLLVMDVFEHAYILDYGIKRADYINGFFKAIDWKIVNDRFLNK